MNEPLSDSDEEQLIIGSADTVILYSSVGEIEKGFNKKDAKTYKFKIWDNVFKFVSKIATEIRNRGKNISVSESTKMAWKDPRYNAAKKQYELFKENFPDLYETLLAKNKKEKQEKKNKKKK